MVAPIAAILAGTFLIWIVLRLLTRDGRRAGLATSLIVALFFAYKPTASLANDILEWMSWLWVHWVFDLGPSAVLPIQAAIAAPVLYLIFRRLEDPGAWTRYLNAFALVLVALPTFNATRARMGEPASPIIREAGASRLVASNGRRPDIYYIILDAYARGDVMKDLFDFDNGPFLERLERKGFYVARESRSNYCQTALSLCSSMNYNYLDALVTPDARDRYLMAELIRDNLVMRSLRPLGYKFVSFSTGYDVTECHDADRFLTPRHPTDNFQMMLVRMTPLVALPFTAQEWDYYGTMRERIRFTLDRLPDIAEEEGPTFTFAHIVAPHHPFVLGADGEDVDPELGMEPGPGREEGAGPSIPNRYREGYRKQAMFLTARVEQAIDEILARSPEPPIIILQSDHGSGLRHHLNDLEKTDLRERMSILNCYYFPDRDYVGLSQAITPVNSFRVVLNRYFGAGLPLLDNRSLFSPLGDYFDLTDVTERLDSGRDRGRTFDSPDSYPGLVH